MARFHKAKMRSLVVHALASAEPGQLSAADLNAVVFLADLMHLAATGETITGESYVRGRAGPVARHLPAIRARLVAEDVLLENVVRTDRGARISLRLASRGGVSPAGVAPLSAMELASLTPVLEQVLCADNLLPVSDIGPNYSIDTVDIGRPIDLRASLAVQAPAVVA